MTSPTQPNIPELIAFLEAHASELSDDIGAMVQEGGKPTQAAWDAAHQAAGWVTYVQSLQLEVERARAAGDEMADKLWVLRCENPDAKSRAAAEAAIDQWHQAFTPHQDSSKEVG